MKTNSKPSNAFRRIAILLFLIPLIGFNDPLEEEGYYGFIYIDGHYKNGTAYTTQIFFLSTDYEVCERGLAYSLHEAREKYGNYLKAYHNFEYPAINSMDVEGFYDMGKLKTRQQAKDRLIEWIGDQKGKNYQVVETDFTYACN